MHKSLDLPITASYKKHIRIYILTAISNKHFKNQIFNFKTNLNQNVITHGQLTMFAL